MSLRGLRTAFSLGLVLTVPAAGQQKTIILATTTSTFDSGLLDSLVSPFEGATGIAVKIIAVGTGAALEMARRGDADAVLVHAPLLEQRYVSSGDLAAGRLVMHNDFVFVGPGDDPAGVKACQDILCAVRALAKSGAFVSRGDRSGTHQMELSLWARAGIIPDSIPGRVESGQGMGATLDIADQRHGYTLTDRGTFLAHHTNRSLVIVFEGDPTLLNIYHAYIVNPDKHAGTRASEARRFVEYLVSPGGQKMIAQFGVSRFGQSLFIPDATRDSTTLYPGTAP
jgi:tungstate transport system substrate-binding protein